MTNDPDIGWFLNRSRLYMHVEALTKDWESHFVGSIHRLKDEDEKERFRLGFAKACLGGVSSSEYERATGWEFDSESEYRAHLAHYWDLFYPDSKPTDWGAPTSPFNSLDGYRGWRNEDGGATYYTVERADGVAVIRIDEPQLVDRRLRVVYELASPSLYDGFARRLIREKILGDVCLGSYAGKVDTIEYVSRTTKNAAVVPYA